MSQYTGTLKQHLNEFAKKSEFECPKITQILGRQIECKDRIAREFNEISFILFSASLSNPTRSASIVAIRSDSELMFDNWEPIL